MKKALFATSALAMLLAFAFGAKVQTFKDETPLNEYIGVRTAQHTSSTTGTHDNVPITHAAMTMLVSSSTAGIRATLTLSTKGASNSANGSIVGTSALTFFTTPAVIAVPAHLNFQKVKLTLNAPGAATASDTRIFSRYQNVLHRTGSSWWGLVMERLCRRL